MNNLSRHMIAIAVSLLVLACLYAVSQYNYLLFHSFAEVFSIIIACGMFMVTWNSRHFLENQYLLLLGCAFLFIGFLDMIHTVGFKGMNLMPGFGANEATQVWVATRFLESITLLFAPLALRRKIQPSFYLLGYGVVTVCLLLLIFYFNYFPDCYLEDAGGLTLFKKASEYVIVVILLSSILVLTNFRHRFDPEVLGWLILSIFLTILSELSFTLYIAAYDFSNLIGHFLKIASFYLIYRAIIVTGLTKPYKVLFYDLQHSRETYRSLFLHMINGFANHRMVYDPAGKPVDYVFLEVNDAFTQMTGLTDVVEKRVTEVVPGITQDSTDWMGVYAKVADTGDSIGFESYSELLGKWFAVSAYSYRKGYFATIFEDISERKRAEAAQRASETRFKLLSETAGRLLSAQTPHTIVYDLCTAVMEQLDCQIFYNFIADEKANQLHLNAFAGITEEQTLRLQCLDYGESVSGCVALDRRQMIAEDIRHQAAPHTELVRSLGAQAFASFPLIAQDCFVGVLAFGSKTRPHFTPNDLDLMQTVANQVALTMQRTQVQSALRVANAELERNVADRTAELARTVETLRDEIAQRGQVELELRQANALLFQRADQLRALTGELSRTEQRERMRLSKLLHDGLQQNLAAIKMQIGCLAEMEGQDGRKPALESILHAIDDSIQMTRSLSADLCPVILYEAGLSEALVWLAGRMEGAYNFHVELALDKIPLLSEEVKVVVFECVRELLFNAVKHSQVLTAKVESKSIPGTGVSLVVSDEGCGFDPSDTNSAIGKGVGFGLFSVRERVGLVGGLINIDSAIGKGSRISLVVPYVQPFQMDLAKDERPEYGIVSAMAAKPESKRPIRLLIADDHALFREGLSRILKGESDIHIVGYAEDGQEAIEYARRFEVDVILMDIRMPRVNGIEATRVIHQEFPKVRIIGLSMNDDLEGARFMRQAGACDYRNKACSASELLTAIRESPIKLQAML